METSEPTELESVLAEARMQRLAYVRRCTRNFDDIFNKSAKLRIGIRDTLTSERVIAQLQRANLDTALDPGRALIVIRSSRGFCNYLVAPEAGIRALLAACLMLWLDPATSLLRDVTTSLEEAAVLAVAQACDDGAQSTIGCSRDEISARPGGVDGEGDSASSPRINGQDPSRNGSLTSSHENDELSSRSHHLGLDKLALETLRESAAETALRRIEAARATTQRILERMLTAEARFPTCAAFLELRAALCESSDQDRGIKIGSALSERTSAAQEGNVSDKDDPGSRSADPVAHTTPESVPVKEYTMGWLDKLNRHGRWQRRWVVVSAARGTLWYHHSPRDEVPVATIALVDAALLDLPPEQIVAARAGVKITHGWHREDGSVRPRVAHGSRNGEGNQAPAGVRIIDAVGVAPVRTTSPGERRLWLRVMQSRSAVVGAAPAPPRDLILRAPSASVREQWTRCIREAMAEARRPPAVIGALARIGLLSAETTPPKGENSGPIGAFDQGRVVQQVSPDGGSVGAVEATRAATEKAVAEAAADAASAAAQKPRASSSSDSGESGPQASGAEGAPPSTRKDKRYEALLRDVLKDASAPASAAEVGMLAKVLPVVRVYVEAVRHRLGDQIAKVIAEGMLESLTGVDEDLLKLI